MSSFSGTVSLLELDSINIALMVSETLFIAQRSITRGEK